MNENKKIIAPLAIGQLISQACSSFELLERLHDGSVVLRPSFSQGEGFDDLKSICERALVMHFVVLVARLQRLCSKFEDAIPFPKDAVRKFKDGTKPIVAIRHANEHGLDPNVFPESELKPEVARYPIPDLGVELVLEHDQRDFKRINGVAYMGNVELRPIYKATKDFEKIAGFIPAHQVQKQLLTKLRQDAG